MGGSLEDFDPMHMLLGIHCDITTDKHEKMLYKFLTFCARQCILLNWLSDKAHSITLWQRVILEYVSLDYLCFLY